LRQLELSQKIKMMITLSSLRDFLTEEELKFLPGRLLVKNCILLTQHKPEEGKPTKIVLQVFDPSGTWIGEITNPDFIPLSK